MNTLVARLSVLVTAALLGPAALAAQQVPIEFDFARLAQGKGLETFNRSVSGLTEGTRNGLRLSARLGAGVAYLQGVEFTNGTIECDLRGKDVQGESFVGIAFHGVDSATYDAIYFRPFNFRAADSARRVHAVQYISHPTYTWQRLRAEHPGAYERAIDPVPDPNGWFHVRIVIAGAQVRVFVADATTPSLVVDRLSVRQEGLVGFWVGNTSSGDFANLRITPE
ncbi:MAG TPA: hypothetical protein VJ816_02030 [Gemmatimonadales bacterium]|nr:hypothetical protein [Gemmatimonadales bacterium]